MKETDFNLSDLDALLDLPEEGEDAIAVIGMAAKIADMDSADALWDALCNGECHIRAFPEERAAQIAPYLRECGKSEPRFEYRAYLERIDEFDAALFRVAPKDAERMDPSQRLFTQIAWQALEDGGYGPKRLDRSRTGVFVGYSAQTHGYAQILHRLNPEEEANALAGTVNSVIASRISYLLNLRGPAMLVDTACSSSLVAVHMACESLRRGECSMALAGGVKLILTPGIEEDSEVSVASIDGLTRSFDEASQGTGGGEGVAAVLLKPYRAALQDRDHIYAVIKGSAVNQDGQTVGITAPNTEAQQDMLLEAWERAGVPLETAGYIEAHGTATRLGDSIEIDALTKAFRTYTSDCQFCGIGSAKTNVGHLDSAAGILGLIKAIKVAQTGKIPPSLHFCSPNRQLDLVNSPLYVNDRLSDWRGSLPRRVGVSSFGMSGTNCHVVLEQPPEQTQSAHNAPCILTLSAVTEATLRRMIRQYVTFFETTEASLQDICHTSNLSRGDHKLRAAFLLQKKEEFASLAQEALQKASCIGAYGGETAQMRSYLDGGEVPCTDGAYTVSLPTYPFEKTSYWVREQRRSLPQTAKRLAHPLLDRILVDTRDCRVYESCMSVARTMELREHSLGGHPTLAGTVYIELIRAAMEPLLRSKKMELCDLVFLAPLSCAEGEERLVQTVIVRKGEDWQLSILSKNADSEDSIPHLETMVRALHDAPNAPVLAQLQAEFAPYLHENYVANNDDFIKIGPHWNLPIEVYSKGNRVLSHVWMPQEMQDVLTPYGLYPALLDGSIHGCNVLNPTGFCLPFCFGSLRLYGKTTAQSYGLMEKAEGAEGLNTYDGVLYTETGEVVAELRRYSMRAVEENEQSIFGKKLEAAMHRIVWEKNEASVGQRGEEDVLLLCRPDQARNPICAQYPCVQVAQAEDLRCILDARKPTRRLIFLHGLQAQEDDVRLLHALCRYLEENKTWQTELSVVTAKAYAVLTGELADPTARMLSAMVQSLGQECSRLQVSCVDTDGQMLSEALRRAHTHVTVAYRNGVCYVPRMEAYRPKKEKEISFQADGVYLITGGLGGMGRVIAEDILRQEPNAHIALLTRRNVHPTDLPKQLQVCTCDVTDKAALRVCMENLRRSYGKILGVFHAAGIAGGGIYLRRTWQEFSEVLAPKTLGTRNLYELLRDEPPAFMLLFSSYASVLYPMGQADYVAANACLDAFCTQAKWIKTINWTGWSETGMAVAHGADQSKNAVVSLTNAEALTLMYRAMSCDAPQLLLGRWSERYFDPTQYTPYYLLPTEVRTMEEPNQMKSVQLFGKLSGEPTDTELQVAQAWAKVLGLAEVDYFAKFLEVGGDSISAAALQKELNEHYPGVLDITDVFVYPSVGEMAGYIDANRNGPTPAAASAAQDDTMDLLAKLSSGDIDLEQAMALIGG